MTDLIDRAKLFAAGHKPWAECYPIMREMIVEIERLRADRQALLDASSKTAELVMKQGLQSIEQQTEIEGLRVKLAERDRISQSGGNSS